MGGVPVGPMPVGPMPVDPMLLGPLLVFVVAGMCRSCFGVVVAYSCFFGWGDVSGVFFWRLGVFFAQARLDVVSFFLAFVRCLAPQALSRPGRGCRSMAQCWWLFAFLVVAVACRLPNLLLYLRPLSLCCSFGCAVLAAIAPLPFVMALLFSYGAAAVGDCAASAGDPSFRCWRPRCCRW